MWKPYLETVLDEMTWMKTVSEKGVALRETWSDRFIREKAEALERLKNEND
ncbi:hypothetical protein [Intestinirhabdus alba]|uniref:Uncharacterized protein n=1 Tax=Intestinirhabdus alba TaxID=2899544 RepID=A0A6L6IP25_9ENTR|nr:hypothetical protein [Intestinirhabdus alba]MTH48632.1 hypothetical protein [Intestinirhabdus alba]